MHNVYFCTIMRPNSLVISLVLFVDLNRTRDVDWTSAWKRRLGKFLQHHNWVALQGVHTAPQWWKVLRISCCLYLDQWQDQHCCTEQFSANNPVPCLWGVSSQLLQFIGFRLKYDWHQHNSSSHNSAKHIHSVSHAVCRPSFWFALRTVRRRFLLNIVLQGKACRNSQTSAQKRAKISMHTSVFNLLVNKVSARPTWPIVECFRRNAYSRLPIPTDIFL